MTPEVLGREPPQDDQRDAELGAPSENLLGFDRPPPVGLHQTRQPPLAGVAPVAILDEPQVSGEGPLPDIG